MNLKSYVNPFNPSPTEDCMSDNVPGDLKSIEIAEGIPSHLGIHICSQTTSLELDFINAFFFYKRKKTLKCYMKEVRSNKKQFLNLLAGNNG